MMGIERKWFGLARRSPRVTKPGRSLLGGVGTVPLFNPAEGKVVREAPGAGPGYWAGACSALQADGKFYLYYRLRKPRDLGRGYECRIADSLDGLSFTDIWSAKKEEFGTSSVERASLFKTLEGSYRLYISYVDPADNRWRIDVMEADSPSGLKPTARKKVLTGPEVGVEGVKDPVVLLMGRMHYMIVSYASPTPAGKSAGHEEMHGTGDAYNTGLVKSYTGLATSGDGLSFEWQGNILDVGRGWDAYESRITCLIYSPPVFNAFYDGIARVEENYEERTGLAMSLDLRTFEKITLDGPALVSPHASGSLRYIDAVQLGNRIYYYYEMARPDGAHDLMVNMVGWSDVQGVDAVIAGLV